MKTGSQRKTTRKHYRTRNGKKFLAGKKGRWEGAWDKSPVSALHTIPVPNPSGDLRIKGRKKTKKIGIFKDEDGLYNLTLPYTGYRIDVIDAYDKVLHDYTLSEDGRVITLHHPEPKLLAAIKQSVTDFAAFKRHSDSHKTSKSFEKSEYLNNIMGKTYYLGNKKNGKPFASGNETLKKSYDREHKPTLYYDRLNKLKEKEDDKYAGRKLKPLTKKVKYKKERKSTFHPHINK